MKLSFLAFVLCSLAQAADAPTIHNMIVFGTNPIYVSHLPMYEHGVHRYQAIYEVTFGAEADREYGEKKRTVKEKIFGISPLQKFTMPSLKKGSKFPAALHPGHPEMIEAIGSVQVEVLRVVHFHPLLKEGAERPKNLTYFSVGKNHLVHLLTTPTKGLETPADQFDQVVEVARVIQPKTLEELILPDGATITLGASDTAASHLTVTPDSKHFSRATVSTKEGSFEALLQISSEDYLHTGGDVRVE